MKTMSISRLRAAAVMLATLVLAAVAGALSGATAASAHVNYSVPARAAQGFNLRGCPDLACTKVGGIAKGDYLDVICKVPGTVWQLVWDSSNHAGYAEKKNLDTTEWGETGNVCTKWGEWAGAFNVLTQNTGFYTCPGTQCSQSYSFPKGTAVIDVCWGDVNNKWHLVFAYADRKVGFVPTNVLNSLLLTLNVC